jgi:hypothetical protein
MKAWPAKSTRTASATTRPYCARTVSHRRACAASLFYTRSLAPPGAACFVLPRPRCLAPGLAGRPADASAPRSTPAPPPACPHRGPL